MCIFYPTIDLVENKRLICCNIIYKRGHAICVERVFILNKGHTYIPLGIYQNTPKILKLVEYPYVDLLES